MLGLEHAKNTNSRSQTHTEMKTKLYKVRQDTYVPETEERDLLMIYTKYKRITIGSQELSPEINQP